MKAMYDKSRNRYLVKMGGLATAYDPDDFAELLKGLNDGVRVELEVIDSY